MVSPLRDLYSDTTTHKQEITTPNPLIEQNQIEELTDIIQLNVEISPTQRATDEDLCTPIIDRDFTLSLIQCLEMFGYEITKKENKDAHNKFNFK